MKSVDESLLPYCETERQKAVIRALIDYGSKRKAAQALGIGHSAVQQHAHAVQRRAVLQGWSPENDLDKPLPDPLRLKRHSQFYYADGSPAHKWVIAEPDKQRQAEMIKEAIDALCASVPPAKPIPAPSPTSDHSLCLYPLADPHIGLYAWAAEAGENFDLNIAQRDILGAIDYLVSRAPASERGVLLNLGDFFHTENVAGVTERSGHVLDVDTRYPRMVDVGMYVMRRCIDRMLEKHQVVELVNCPGNHDESLAHVLTSAFKQLYEGEPRVHVHPAPTERHYIEHGTVLIGGVHGHKTKDQDLPGIMAAEVPQAWGRTRHRSFFRGHHHHDDVKEYNGCRVEQVRAMAARDAFAVGSGYLSGRDLKLVVLHPEAGETARFTCGIDVARSQWK